MTETQTELTKQVLAAIQGMQVIKSYNLAGTNNRKLEKSIKDTSSLLLKLEKVFSPILLHKESLWALQPLL